MRTTAGKGGDDRGGEVSRETWKWSVLAGMASYLDAGSIVALGAGLALWQEELGLGSSAVGLLAAIGPNAVGAALGAFRGRLGDRLGRKRIYQYDLLLYAFGILCIVFAVNAPMLFAGTVIVAIAVGADVPTSLALVGESRPRGRAGSSWAPPRSLTRTPDAEHELKMELTEWRDPFKQLGRHGDNREFRQPARALVCERVHGLIRVARVPAAAAYSAC